MSTENGLNAASTQKSCCTIFYFII